MASNPPPSELAAWLARQRWFASKTRRIEAVAVADRVPVGDGAVLLIDVTLEDVGTRARYAVPLLEGPSMRDALDDAGFCRSLLAIMAEGARAHGKHGALTGSWTRAVRRPGPEERVARLAGEQSNTSVTFGTTLIVKHFRRLTDCLLYTSPSPRD